MEQTEPNNNRIIHNSQLLLIFYYFYIPPFQNPSKDYIFNPHPWTKLPRLKEIYSRELEPLFCASDYLL